MLKNIMNKACKKVLYIHHGKGLGGAPLSLLYLIKALDTTKYHPVVLFLHYSDAFDLYKQQGVEVYGPVNRLDFPHTKIWWFRWYHIPYFLRFLKDTFITYLWTADHWLTKLKPDIVHLNTSSLVAWGAIAKRKRIPVIWHIREPLAPGYLGLRRWFITRCIEKHATTIIPISKHDAQPWVKNPKTIVIHNPVDPAIFDATISPEVFIKKYNLNPKAPTILFLGGVSSEKGTLVILRVFQQLLKKLPNAHLLVAGYWNLVPVGGKKGKRRWLNLLPAQRYKNSVAKALIPVQHAVTILGPINTVPEAMAASHVIVFPATIGHFARPIIEAGFMKKPVIASKLPPLDELVIDGKTGYLVSPTGIQAWVEKLSLVLTNQKINVKLGIDAQNFCRGHFSLATYYKKVSTIYDRITQTGKFYE